MAITQASLAEEILSRQERAVIRGIYRAMQLNDALTSLVKIQESFSMTGKNPSGVNPDSPEKAQISLLKEYLERSIITALVSTKVPANALNKDKPQSQSA